MDELAIKKAKEFGIGWVGSNNGNHSGAGAHYVNRIADEGLVGIYLAVGSANHMAPTGGSSRLLSTNPIAFGVPAGHGKPHVILDMATTVTAFGKIKVKVLGIDIAIELFIKSTSCNISTAIKIGFVG